MFLRAAVLWVIGLLTLVPWGIYYLFFNASSDQYALVIVSVLFWIFGYWGVVGPILAAIRVQQVMKLIEMVKTREQLRELVQKPEMQETAIDLIAGENHISKFLARRVLTLLVGRFVAEEVRREQGQ